MAKPVTFNPRVTPHKLIAYLSALVFGIMCGPLPFHSAGIQNAFKSFAVWEDVWSYLLLISALVCIVGTLAKSPLIGLPLETGGLIGAFFGWLVYSLAIIANTPSAPTLVLAIGLAVSALWQAFQCQRELHNISIAGTLPIQTITVPVLEEGGSGELFKGDK